MPVRCLPLVLRRPSLALWASGLITATAVKAEPPAATWAQEAMESMAASISLETPALRALRLAEEELFGAGYDQPPQDYDPDCIYGAPDALSSDVPASPAARTSDAGDLEFLHDLKLPQFPVRWDSRVIDYLDFFKNHPRGRELAAAWLRRRERYGPMIRRVLAEHSLPADLEYVAMIESGYDPVAHSHADARGLWQFVESSGEYYGLRIDHWLDERLDPERATRAAARFLRDLYDRFHSWELAFAGYNMGYGGLLRALRKYNTNDYWLLSHLEAGLPFETSIYVAKITAMAIVGNNPDRFGFGNLTPEPPKTLAKVDVAPGTPVRTLAVAAELSAEEFRQLNPHILRKRIPPGDAPVQVYIPQERFERFAQRWARQRQPDLHKSYLVRFGESLEDVARRFRTSSAALRELNELPPEMTIGAGFPLVVPAGRRELTRSAAAARPVVAVPDRAFRYPDRRRVFYRVTGQDTLETIARFFDVTVDEITTWNHLDEGAALQSDLLLQLFVRREIDLGQAVVLTPDEVRVLTVGSEAFFAFHEKQRGRVRVRYRVQPNDTLAGLAKRFALSQGSIGRINQFPSHQELRVDQWIVLYVPEDQVTRLTQEGIIETTETTETGAESEQDQPRT